MLSPSEATVNNTCYHRPKQRPTTQATTARSNNQLHKLSPSEATVINTCFHIHIRTITGDRARCRIVRGRNLRVRHGIGGRDWPATKSIRLVITSYIIQIWSNTRGRATPRGRRSMQSTHINEEGQGEDAHSNHIQGRYTGHLLSS
jgi:hypothetical protein